MPKLKEFLFGKKAKAKKLPTLNPDQEKLLKLISEGITTGKGPFAEFGGFNQEQFDKGITQPSLKLFQEEILPQLQEKFIAGNQALGSGMRRAQIKAATDQQNKLAELMYQAQQGALQNKLSAASLSLGTKPFENIYKPGTPGALQGFAEGLGKSVGNAIGSAMGG